MVQISERRLRQLLEAELMLDIIFDGEVDLNGAAQRFILQEGYSSWDDVIDECVRQECE